MVSLSQRATMSYVHYLGYNSTSSNVMYMSFNNSVHDHQPHPHQESAQNPDLIMRHIGASPFNNEWRDYMMHEIADPRLPYIPQGSEHGGRLPRIACVPRSLFQLSPLTYTPYVLNMGPLPPKLSQGPSIVARCKAVCVQNFIARLQFNGAEIPNVEALAEHLIADPHLLATHIYPDLLSIIAPHDSHLLHNLRLLVTVDAVFLHEFMVYDIHKDNNPTGYLATFLSNGIITNEIVRDLFLIGNQIPLAFLKDIVSLQRQPGIDLNSLAKWLLEMSRENSLFISQSSGVSSDENALSGILECKHVLDCLYVSCTQNRREEVEAMEIDINSEPSHESCVPTASQLSKAGIRFKAWEGNVSVINYDKTQHQLNLPKLIVYDETEYVLKNLLAYEQTSKEGGDLTRYADIMDSLINTEEDVAVLTKAGVITNLLGSDKRLVEMWNDMCINVVLRPSPAWVELSNDVWHHYESRWRHWVVEFLATYFSKPWYWVSLIVGFMLLVCSILQTVYTILGYKFKP